MPKTEDEIKEVIRTGVLSRKYKDAVWGDISSAINTASQEQKDLLIQYLSKRDREKFATIIFDIIEADFRGQAESRANNILVNGSASLSELQEFL